MRRSSEEIQFMVNEAKTEVLKSIREILDEEFGGQLDLTEDEEFEDEAHNRIQALNTDDVFFDDKYGGDLESYPLGELGMDDAIYVLAVLEQRMDQEEQEMLNPISNPVK